SLNICSWLQARPSRGLSISMAITAEMKPVLETTTVRVGRSPMNGRKKAVWEWKIVRRAVRDAFLKLNPRKMMGNPVMIAMEIGTASTTALIFDGGAATP